MGLRIDAQENRSLLLRAARDLIAVTGSDDVSARDIADRAGVSSATLYRHFESKRDLIDGISVDRWRRAAGWARGTNRRDQSFADIVSTLDRFSWMVAADAAFIAAAGLDVGRTPYAIEPMRRVFDERFALLWSAARAKGEVRAWVDPRDVIDVLGSVRDAGRQTAALKLVVSGFAASHIDADVVVRATRMTRPVAVRL